MGKRNRIQRWERETAYKDGKEKQLTQMGKRNSLQRWERETTNKDGKEKQL